MSAELSLGVILNILHQNISRIISRGIPQYITSNISKLISTGNPQYITLNVSRIISTLSGNPKYITDSKNTSSKSENVFKSLPIATSSNRLVVIKHTFCLLPFETLYTMLSYLQVEKKF